MGGGVFVRRTGHRRPPLRDTRWSVRHTSRPASSPASRAANGSSSSESWGAGACGGAPPGLSEAHQDLEQVEQPRAEQLRRLLAIAGQRHEELLARGQRHRDSSLDGLESEELHRLAPRRLEVQLALGLVRRPLAIEDLGELRVIPQASVDVPQELGQLGVLLLEPGGVVPILVVGIVDPRLTSAACLVNHARMRIDDRLADHIDVIGINEYYGWYEEDFEDLAAIGRNSKPGKPVVISETGADADITEHGPKRRLFSEAYMTEVYRKQIAILRSIPFVAGMTPWILYDFRCERRQNAFQRGYNRKGLIAADKATRKEAFSVLAAYYDERRQEDSSAGGGSLTESNSS